MKLFDKPKPRTREAELLEKLSKFKPADEDMAYFLVRTHISDGAITDEVGCLWPRTLRRIEIFLKREPPKPESNEDRYITLI